MALTALSLAVLWAPRGAHAFDADLGVLGRTSLDFTNTTLVRFIDEAFGTSPSSDDILTVLNKMNALVTRDPLTIGIRFDMAYFPLEGCSWDADSDCVRKDYTQVEKVFASWVDRNFTLTAGDFYASYGKGIVLSVRKADELGLDTTIRGGKGEARIGPLAVEVLGGLTNAHNVNLAQARDNFIRDPDDVVAGAQATLSLDSGIEVAVRGAHYWYETPSALGHEETAGVAGASLSFLDLGGASLYFEGAVLRHEDFDPQTGDSNVRDGYALYAQATAQFGSLSATIEAKHYDTFQLAPPDDALRNAFIRYHEPPTLERIDQLVPSFSDATGGRLLVEYVVPSTYTRIYGNFVGYVYGPRLGADAFGDEGAHVLHGYGGVAQSFGAISAEVSAGYREDNDNENGELNRNLIHAEAEVSAVLSGPHGLALKWWHRSEEKRLAFSTKSFELGLATLTYSYNPYLKLTALFGYNTEFEDRATEPTEYYAGQVDLLFWNSSALRVFAGQIPGGIVCAGGTCVQVPASSQYTFQLVTRF
jgi:hypothetical protein